MSRSVPTPASLGGPPRTLSALLDRVQGLRRQHVRARLQIARLCRHMESSRREASVERALRQERQAALAQSAGVELPPRPAWDPDPVAAPILERARRIRARRGPLPAMRLDAGGGLALSEGGQGDIGLNAMKLYQYEDDVGAGLDDPNRTKKYGNVASAWLDPTELGVGVVRQFGPRDLRWNLLTAWDDSLRRVPIPPGEDAVRTLVLEGFAPEATEETNVDRFAAVLLGAFEAGVKVRFTFLTLGLGTDLILENPDTGSVEVGAVTPEGFSTDLLDAVPTAVYPAWALQRRMLRMYWDPAFVPAGVDLPVGERNFWLRCFDPSSALKRRYVYYLARACAELLVSAAEQARSSLDGAAREDFSLERVLDGIEIFNEVGGRNVVHGGPATADDADLEFDPEQTGLYWGLAWIEAARGFVEFFAEKGLGVPQLYLPGVASYAGADVTDGVYGLPPGQQWTFKQQFLDSLLSTVRAVWDFIDDLHAAFSKPLPEGSHLWWPALEEVVGGIDYHWYHHKRSVADGGTDPLGPLHAGWLAVEVDWLGQLLESYGLDGRVTVFETGTSAIPDGAIFLPDGATDTASFQAAEVFRRLLATWVGGGERMGWHAWMSTGAGEYQGFGLRKDSQPSESDAGVAEGRASWFALHRLSTWFASASSLRLVRPDLDAEPFPAREELVLEAPTSADAFAGEAVFPNPGVLVFELRGPTLGTVGTVDLSTYDYAYVVLVDPVTRDGSSRVVELQRDGDDPEAFELEPFVVDPAPYLEDPPDDVDPELWLPRYRVFESMAEPVPVAVPSSGAAAVEVLPGGPPLIIVARHPLRWPS